MKLIPTFCFAVASSLTVALVDGKYDNWKNTVSTNSIRGSARKLEDNILLDLQLIDTDTNRITAWNINRRNQPLTIYVDTETENFSIQGLVDNDDDEIIDYVMFDGLRKKKEGSTS